MSPEQDTRPSVRREPIRVGLLGYGKAGRSVAAVLAQESHLDLRWVLRRDALAPPEALPGHPQVLVQAVAPQELAAWLDAHPVDALVDFSHASALPHYAPLLRERGIALVSAISAYPPETLALARELGRHTRVMCSPNITLGINFLIFAARLLRSIAPQADVAIMEEHFRGKPEVSGTARKIAQTLDVDESQITALRLGGIVGHHEVVFGFPHQTVRLVHDSIRREAFGTGAAFALRELVACPRGFYSFEDLLMRQMRDQLALLPA